MESFLASLVVAQMVLLYAVLWGQVHSLRKIMSKISDLVARQNVAFGRLDVALADIAEDVATLAADATSPADIAALTANVEKSEAQATTAEALAALTANPVPTPA